MPGTREGASAGSGRIRGLPKWRINIMLNHGLTMVDIWLIYSGEDINRIVNHWSIMGEYSIPCPYHKQVGTPIAGNSWMISWRNPSMDDDSGY